MIRQSQKKNCPHLNCYLCMFVCIAETLILTNQVDFLTERLGIQYILGFDTEMVKRGTILLLQK